MAQARLVWSRIDRTGWPADGADKAGAETALNIELAEHLGHEHGEPAGTNGNVRNGYSAKTVRTEVGDVRIRVPRDRAGTFEPVMVPKHARHLSGFDETVISMYAKGMTTGDIVNYLQDVYGSSVSKDLVQSHRSRCGEDAGRPVLLTRSTPWS